MWGRFYWGRKERGAEGVVVVFAWLSSEEKHLRHYVALYGSLGWNSLVCHTDFLTLFFPDKAASLASIILGELIKEIKIGPLPVVFNSFSGGSKTCLYKVLQVIDRKCEGQHGQDEYQQVKDCVCGQIYDSSPVDFTSDLGTRFVLHPTLLKTSSPPRIVSWMARSIASGLDALFLNRFEAQRADYWQTLYSSVDLGPFLIFCSEDDELASYSLVSNFAKHLRESGGDVNLLKWNSSPHVGHYKIHPEEYKAAVAGFLVKAAVTYSQRMKRVKGVAGGCNPITKSIYNLRKAATNSNESLRRVAVGPSDHFFLPSSVEYHEIKGEGSIPDEQRRTLFQLENPPGVNALGVLGRILFDECVPKNIEDWDLKPSGFLQGKQLNPSIYRRGGHYNPIKCIRRSRL